jgi:hypothetical protein
MTESASPLRHDLRRRAVHALVILGAVLATMLAGGALAGAVPVNYGGLPPSLVVRDGDAKAVRPEQQVGFREPGRSIRLGSSSGPKSILFPLRSQLRASIPSARALASHISGHSPYLQRRTRCPREPPLPLA